MACGTLNVVVAALMMTHVRLPIPFVGDCSISISNFTIVDTWAIEWQAIDLDGRIDNATAFKLSLTRGSVAVNASDGCALLPEVMVPVCNWTTQLTFVNSTNSTIERIVREFVDVSMRPLVCDALRFYLNHELPRANRTIAPYPNASITGDLRTSRFARALVSVANRISPIVLPPGAQMNVSARIETRSGVGVNATVQGVVSFADDNVAVTLSCPTPLTARLAFAVTNVSEASLDNVCLRQALFATPRPDDAMPRLLTLLANLAVNYSLPPLSMPREDPPSSPPHAVWIGLALAWASGAALLAALGWRLSPTSGGRIMLLEACWIVAVMFVISNVITAATVQLDGEFDWYSFSLGTTVRDLWRAGLYPLAVFIVLFSGVWPYFKLGSLAWAIVTDRRSTSFLQVVDVVGKYSLLDTTVMVIMAVALAVPRAGVTVTLHAGFFLFLLATLASMLLGTLVTRHRRHAPIGRRARAGLALLAVLLAVESTVTQSVEYEYSGPATLVVGHVSRYSLGELLATFRGADTVVAAIIIAVCVLVPVIMMVTGDARLFSWAAYDVVLVSMLAGLLQLHQFVAFILGEAASRYLYAVRARLLWPGCTFITLMALYQLLFVGVQRRRVVDWDRLQLP